MSYLPAITPAQWRTAPAKIEALASLLLVRDAPAEPEASRGDPAELRVMWDFEGLPRRTLAEGERTESLAGEIDGPPDLRLQARCSMPGGEAVFPAEVGPGGLGQGFAARAFPPGPPAACSCAGAGPADPSVEL